MRMLIASVAAAAFLATPAVAAQVASSPQTTAAKAPGAKTTTTVTTKVTPTSTKSKMHARVKKHRLVRHRHVHKTAKPANSKSS